MPGQIGRRRSGAGGGARVASTQASETFAADLRQNANSYWTNGLATLRAPTPAPKSPCQHHQPDRRRHHGGDGHQVTTGNLVVRDLADRQQRKRPPRTAAGLIPARGLGSDRLPLRAIRSGTIRRIAFMEWTA